MDPFTQAALGAAVGQFGFARRLGRPALLVGAIAAAAPDLDVLIKYDVWSGWVHHRGITHSLFAPLVLAPIAGFALWKLDRAGRGGFASWSLLFALAMLTHAPLDYCTSYGTQLFAPVTDTRFALDAIAVIDPLYTLPLAIAVIVGGIAGGRARPRLVVGSAGLALAVSSAYMAYTWWLNEAAAAHARAELGAAGARAEVRAYPSIFQPWLRRIVARDDDLWLVGYVSMLAPGPIAWRTYPAVPSPAIETVRRTRGGRIFEWFAMGLTFYETVDNGAGTEVRAFDLRYGRPDGPYPGLWGIRAGFDAAGVMVASPRPFSVRTTLSREALELLWMWTVRGRGP